MSELIKTYFSLAGVMEPGDGTRYEFVAVQKWDHIDVIVMNDGFFDKISFVPWKDEPYRTFREANQDAYRHTSTNSWTIKAAQKMRDLLTKAQQEQEAA